MNVVQTALKQQASASRRASRTAPHEVILDGSLMLHGKGRAVHEIRFPVWFIEQSGVPPRFFWSGSVGENESIVLGNPVWDVGVLRWITRSSTSDSSPLYVGVEVAVSCVGATRSVVTWECHGLALTPGGLSDRV